MKTVVSVVLIAFFMVTATAQEKQRRARSDFSPEQMAEIQTKKMALYLDLSESQQRDVLEINRALAEKRKQKMERYKAMKEKGERLSDEERFNHANAQLDEQLEVQKKMKKILNEEQYQKWRKMSAKKQKKAKEAKKRIKQRRSRW